MEPSSLRASYDAAPEVGSLASRAPGQSDFIGSSSGIYFIDTVKKAFASSRHRLSGIPEAAETISDTEEAIRASEIGLENEPSVGLVLRVDSEARKTAIATTVQLGMLPSKETARQLSTEYFRNWHPLFPFLAGARFLDDLDELYADTTLLSPGGTLSTRDQACRFILFKSVFDIGAAHLPAAAFPPTYTPSSASEVFTAILSLATRHDIATIQTVLAVQLSCVARMALRNASTLAGILQRLTTHAGLHRCPFRYPQLSSENCSLRKRIFWSVYALDRYLSQALGLPLTISDSDVDVCVPTATEAHSPKQSASVSRGTAYAAYASVLSPEDGSCRRHRDVHTDWSSSKFLPRETTLANYIAYGRLVGRALELYHKSIHVRSISQETALFLRSDIEHWYNNLPEELQVIPSKPSATPTSSRFTFLFQVLHQQLIILINRPLLSLPRARPEFFSALQAALSAARTTLAAFECLDHCVWPGSMSSIWMSGLVIAFACQMQSYNLQKGSREIARCAALLRKVAPNPRLAQRCHGVLSTLLEELQHMSSDGIRNSAPSNDDPARYEDESESRKRPRSEDIEVDPAILSGRESTYTGDAANPKASGQQRRGSRSVPNSFASQTQCGTISQEYGLKNARDTSFSEFGAFNSGDLFQDLAWENLVAFTDPNADGYLL